MAQLRQEDNLCVCELTFTCVTALLFPSWVATSTETSDAASGQGRRGGGGGGDWGKGGGTELRFSLQALSEPLRVTAR